MNVDARPLRRRARRSLRARMRTWWIFATLGAIVVSLCAYLFATWPALRVHAVAVRGNRVVDTQEVLAKAAIDADANAWLLDTNGIASRVRAIPYVLDAHVERRPPAAVTVVVTERTPAACLLAGGDATTLDAAGRALQRGCDPALAELTVDVPDPAVGAFVTDTRVALLQRDAAELRGEGFALRRLSSVRYGDLEAIDAGGLRVLFAADGNLAEDVRLVRPILAETKGKIDVATIDLRTPSTPVVVKK